MDRNCSKCKYLWVPDVKVMLKKMEHIVNIVKNVVIRQINILKKYRQFQLRYFMWMSSV